MKKILLTCLTILSYGLSALGAGGGLIMQASPQNTTLGAGMSQLYYITLTNIGRTSLTIVALNAINSSYNNQYAPEPNSLDLQLNDYGCHEQINMILPQYGNCVAQLVVSPTITTPKGQYMILLSAFELTPTYQLTGSETEIEVNVI